MKSNVDSLLFVSRAEMRLPNGSEPAGRSKFVPAGAHQCPPVTALAPPGAEDPLDEDEDVRTALEYAGARPLVAGEDLPPRRGRGATGSVLVVLKRSRGSLRRVSRRRCSPLADFLG